MAHFQPETDANLKAAVPESQANALDFQVADGVRSPNSVLSESSDAVGVSNGASNLHFSYVANGFDIRAILSSCPALCALSSQAPFINGEPGRALHMAYRERCVAMTALAEEAGRSVNHVSRLIAAEEMRLRGGALSGQGKWET